MAITRLSGGTTPANGSDPRTFPAIWNAAADDIEAAESAIGVLQSDLTNLDIDDLADVTITTPADGEVLAYDDGISGWVNQAAPENTGFTASETITATDASWTVPALAHPIARVTVVGAGGGGAGGSGTGGTGGTTTFNAGGAGTITATGGPGAAGERSGQSGQAPKGGLVSGNGGISGAEGSFGWGAGGNSGGGEIKVEYLDMTGISTVNITIGGGGGGAAQGSSGGRGEVIFEYVAG